MPGSFKTEGVVLRSIRFGEADRILHLYTAERGRVNAIAKGSRRPKSRFGGRLEPFFRLDLMLHEGRSDLCTVTGASTVDGYPDLRSDGVAIGAAARGCDAVLRLLDSAEPNRPAYNLLCRYLALLDRRAGDGSDGRPRPGRARRRARVPAQARARGRLLSRARLLRPLRGAGGDRLVLRCRRRRRLRLLRGGRVPDLSPEAHRFMVAAIGSPIAELPEASESALRQVDRAIGDTLAHHAHVNLRAVA